jgi:uncharacterized protein YuzE
MERSSNYLRDKRIDYSTTDNIRSFVSTYDKEIDSLIIQPKKPVPAISIDWDGDFWVRVNPLSGEIVGIEIENYKQFFAKKYHPLLAGQKPTSHTLREVIIALLALGSKPFTKKTFIADLETVCQRQRAIA